MGREYKFRGLTSAGTWVYGDLIQLLGEQGEGRKFIVDNRFGACLDGKGNFINVEYPFVREVDPETVGQYTGLKDKNGTEIYEGDVLSNGQHIDWIVSYREASFQVAKVGSITADSWVLSASMATGREVIGNIHTELLKAFTLIQLSSPIEEGEGE